MRKSAKAATTLATVILAFGLTACDNGHGLLGPNNVGQMNEDDGVRYGALWRLCGTPGDRSDAELLADGKTWVVDKKADVSASASKKYPVKLQVNKKTGKLEVLEFTHGAKAGDDASLTPESKHRTVFMKVSSPPKESASDKLPSECAKKSAKPTHTATKRPSASPSATPSASKTKKPSPTPTAPSSSKTKNPDKDKSVSGGSGLIGGLGGGSDNGKTCKKVNGVTKCT